MTVSQYIRRAECICYAIGLAITAGSMLVYVSTGPDVPALAVPVILAGCVLLGYLVSHAVHGYLMRHAGI